MPLLLQVLRPTLPILIGAAVMLSLSMGLRQSLGLFVPPLTRDIRHFDVRFHAGDRGPESRLGRAAAGRRRLMVHYGFPSADGRRRGALRGRSCPCSRRRETVFSVIIGGGCCIGIRCPARRRRSRIRSARARYRRMSAASCSACVTAVGSLGALIAAPHRAGACRGVRLACRRDRFRRSGSRDDSGGLVRQPGRQDPAAQRRARRNRQHHGRAGAADRVRQRLRSW